MADSPTQIMTPPFSPSTLTAGELHDTCRIHTSTGQQLLPEISHLRTTSQTEVKSQGTLQQQPWCCSLSISVQRADELSKGGCQQGKEMSFLHDVKTEGMRMLSHQPYSAPRFVGPSVPLPCCLLLRLSQVLRSRTSSWPKQNRQHEMQAKCLLVPMLLSLALALLCGSRFLCRTPSLLTHHAPVSDLPRPRSPLPGLPSTVQSTLWTTAISSLRVADRRVQRWSEGLPKEGHFSNVLYFTAFFHPLSSQEQREDFRTFLPRNRNGGGTGEVFSHTQPRQ